MKRLIILLVGITLITPSLGQNYRGEAALPKVEADGFYRISLSPQLGPHLNSNFTNIRVYDQQNKEVPYLFEQENPIHYNNVFQEYEIVEKKQQKNCCTSLVLRNSKETPINNISLSIRNAEVTKIATLL